MISDLLVSQQHEIHETKSVVRHWHLHMENKNEPREDPSFVQLLASEGGCGHLQSSGVPLNQISQTMAMIVLITVIYRCTSNEVEFSLAMYTCKIQLHAYGSTWIQLPICTLLDLSQHIYCNKHNT